MNKAFYAALVTGEPLSAVRERLRDIELSTHSKQLDKIQEDFETAIDVRRAIIEPEGSYPNKWAESFLEEARAKFAEMSADEQEREQMRTVAEVEYWAKIKAAKQHSTK